MRNSHLVFFTIVLIVPLLILSGCTSSSPPVSPTAASEIKTDAQEKTYIVGIYGNNHPFSYYNGSAQGFNVDSMSWIAQKKGMDVTFTFLAHDIPALKAKKIDLIYSGMPDTPEWAEQVNFTQPYWEVNQGVIVWKHSIVSLSEVEEGKTIIGTLRSSTASVWIFNNLIKTGKMPSDNLRFYDNMSLAMDDLPKGNIDAVMCDDLGLENSIANRPLKKVGPIKTKQEYSIAIRKDDPKLLATMNDGLAQLKADPYWQELIVKYKMK